MSALTAGSKSARGIRLGSTLAAFAFALLLLAGPAQGSKGVVQIWGSAATGATPPGYHTSDGLGACLPSDPIDCIYSAGGVAVNDTTGDVYITDRINSRVDRFSEDGEFERTWGWDVDPSDPSVEFEICVAPGPCKWGLQGSGPGQFNLPENIAIDQSNGDVYVSSRNGTSKFDRDGNFIRSQSAGGALAVKPFSNSLLVAGGGISWLDSSGNPLANFGFDFPGYPASSVGADAAGNIYAGPVQDATGKYPVLKLSSGGAPLGQFAPDALNGQAPGILAVDPVNDRVYVSRFDRPVKDTTAPGNARTQIAEFDTSGNLLDLHATGMIEPWGIAVNSSTGRIYSVTAAHLYVIDTVADPPVPVIDSIDSITDSGATLTGTVDPRGSSFSTGYHWEYRKQGTQSWTSIPDTDTDVGNGTDAQPAGPQPISGLEPNTTYEVRLLATRQGGAGSGIDTDSFKTLALPPTVTARSAYPVGDTTAQLRGVVHPRKSDTTYFFEYGPDEDYGQTTPVQNAGAGNVDVPAYATVRDLDPETTYHFRLVADNGVGDPVEGDDLELRTQSTAAMAWPRRGTELVTPPDTGSQNPSSILSRHGDRAVWATLTGAPGAPAGNAGAFLAERTLDTPTGWRSHSLLPPIGEMIGNGESIYVGIRASDDFSRVAFLAPDGPDVVFVRIEADGTQTVLGSMPAWPVIRNTGDVTADANLDHVFLRISHYDMVPAGSATTGALVYDIGSGSPRLVSRMPDNSVPKCGVVDGFGFDVGSGFMGGAYDWFSSAHGPNVPFRLYFETAGENCTTPGDQNDVVQLYMRDDKGTPSEADDESTLVSGPVVDGPDDGGYFLRTNEAGDQVVYWSTSRLTEEDTNSTRDLYKWTKGEGNECMTCIVPDANVISDRGYERSVLVSPDLSRMYFRSKSQLIPGKGIAGSENNVYVLRDLPEGREIGYVGQGSTSQEDTEISENGEVIIFRSDAAGVTPDRTGGFEQYYRYDDADGNTECISCPPPGEPAGAVTGIDLGGFAQVSINQLADPQLMDEAGDTFVFSSSVRYVPEDVNGTIDVYEWRRDGRLRLVTDGVTRFPNGPAAPALQGISASGDNIMYSVGAKLTGWEIESTRQVFMAKEGGGFPPPDPPTEPCLEDACQGPLVPAPPLLSAGSKRLNGQGNFSPEKSARKPRRACGQSKVKRRSRCVSKRKLAARACKKRKGKAKRRCVNRKVKQLGRKGRSAK